MRLHHVQVSCPPGGEDVARRFWGEGLGLVEVEKPEPLRARGGCWFRGPGPVEVHVGVEDPFRPAGKAHPALLLDDVAALDAAGARLEALGFTVDHAERDTFPGFVRLHCFDGQGEEGDRGNRVELLA